MPVIRDRRWFILSAPLLAMPSLPLFAQAPTGGPVPMANIDRRGLALRGYDPVAYFTVAKPMRGLDSITSTIVGGTYRFTSVDNKAAFDADPAKYIPQYGGFCAWAAANGYKADADPTVWAVEGGKLYVNYNAAVGRSWQADKQSLIAKADANWPKVQGLPLR